MPLPSLPTLPQNNGVQGPQSGATPAPIHVARYARNGLLPHAVFETELGNSLNFAARIRAKNLCTWFVPFDDIPTSSASSRVRWRFAAHTSPMCHRVKAMVYMARQSDGLSSGGGNPSVTIAITNADESTTHATATLEFGAAATTVSDVPSDFQWAEMTLSGVPANTAVYGYVQDEAKGRIISATIYEECLPIWDGNGYPRSQVAVTSPILDDRRSDMLQLATNLWKQGAAQLWNWTVDGQSTPHSTSSTTYKNLIDDTSTTVSAATPGATLDLRYCRTRSLATVPCVMAVYGSWDDVAATDPGGSIKLVDSTGATLASITDGWTHGADPAWVTTTFDAPADLEKLDLQYASNSSGLSGTFNVGAVSIFQYEA